MFILRVLLICFCCLGGSACTTHSQDDAVTQVSLINALLAGLYDGTSSEKDVRRWGDLGIGTFDTLDGEMIILDGVAYQANIKGEVHVRSAYRSPFLTVKHFSPDDRFSLDHPVSFDALKHAIDARLPDRNHVYALRIKGDFSFVAVRSVPAQKKPYPLLTDVVKTQPEFERQDVSGTLVGFFVPAYAQGVNVAGYHFHFLSDSKDFGGHVLKLEMRKGEVLRDRASEWRIVLPDDQAFCRWQGQSQGEAAIRAVENKAGK